MSAYRSDRQIVEAIIPAYLMRGIVVEGTKDPTEGDNLAAIRLLDEAITSAVHGETADRQRKLISRAVSACDQATGPYREQEIEVGKFGLIAYYAMREVVDAGALVIEDGSPFDRALTPILDAIADWTRTPAVDASAQKQAPKFLRGLQALGYFRSVAS